MKRRYVPPQNALKKLQTAYSMHLSVCITGASGYGKTALVKNTLPKDSYLYIDCSKGFLEESELSQPTDSSPNVSTIVLDNFQSLLESPYLSHLLHVLSEATLPLIIVSRSVLPDWFVLHASFDSVPVHITENDLLLSLPEVQKLAEAYQVELSEEEVESILQRCHGNALALLYALNLLKESNEEINTEFEKKISRLFEEYLEYHVITPWEPDLQLFLTKVSIVDSFSTPLAEAMTSDPLSSTYIQSAKNAGSFLSQNGDEYFIRAPLLSALRNRAERVLGRAVVNQLRFNAAHYYELQDNITLALQYYKLSGNNQNISSLLVRNSKRHPGSGHYWELRSYYFALPDSEVKKSPSLMSALSMLYSITMNRDKSEEWYQALVSYAQSAYGGQKREALTWITYLDIGLPHRGSSQLIEILKGCASLLLRGKRLPEFSLTNNQPSLMNGGKDFCSWSKQDQFLADTMGVLVSKLLGCYQQGLVPIALSESFYEKGKNNLTVLSQLMSAQMEAEKGSIELFFVVVGLQARFKLLWGEQTPALQLLDSFEKRVRNENAFRLLPSIAALRCRLLLYRSDEDAVAEWMQDAPNENVTFCTLERYRYMVKVRCYIASSNYLSAMSLLEQMRYFAELNGRTYISIEVALLSAIVRFRTSSDWLEQFTSAILLAQEYHFVRIISEEGASVLPLLKACHKKLSADKRIDPDWLEQVMQETTKVAELYPSYGSFRPISPLDFSDTAIAILRMQSEGKTTREIAKELFLSERTIKYHNAETYRKLNVKNKSHAVQKACLYRLL